MNWSRTVIVIIVAISLYLVFIFFSDIGKIIDTIKEINKEYLSASIVLWVITVIAAAMRWHIYLKQISKKISVIQNLMYYLAGYAFVFSPGGVGEIIRSPFIKRDFGIPISKTAPLVFVERFYDLLGVIIVISIGLIYSNFAKVIIIIPVGLAIVIFIIIKNKSLFLKIINMLSRLRFINKMLPDAEESHEVIFNLTNGKNFLLGTLVSTFNSFLLVIAVYLLILGMHGTIYFADLTVIYQTSNFAAVVSLMPGGIGILEGGLTGMLVLYKVKYEIALSVAILVRIISTGLFSAIGLASLRMISKKISFDS